MKKILLTIASFSAFLSIGICHPITCPAGTELEPCVCKRMAYGLHVVCANLDDTYAFVNALSNLRNYKVQNLLLHRLMLRDVLPKDLFHEVGISEISVESSVLTFSQPAFTGLDETLQILSISKNSVIKSSGMYDIAKLSNLRELNIKKNPLSIVKNNWLNGQIPSVESIRLEEDEITEIESYAFADLHLLRSISIAGNRVRNVKRTMFPMPAKRLTVMDLSDNELKILPEDFFSEMPTLETVLLSGNDLTTLPENTWKRVWKQLDSVELLGNSIVCDSSLNWLTTVKWPERVDAECVAPGDRVGKNLKEVYGTYI